MKANTQPVVTQRAEVFLNIGEVSVSAYPETYVCHGLGSCIALFISDISSTVSGAAHIMLPGNFQQQDLLPTCFSTNAIAALRDGMMALGSDGRTLQAKMVGGSSMYVTSLPIGKMNYVVVAEELSRHNIRLVGKDIGGTISRTARFRSTTAEVEVSSAHGLKYKIKI
jgi:chemotaxis protein CheD